MRRAVRISAWTLGGLLALVLTTGIAVLIAGNTTAGRHLLEDATARLSSGRVRLVGLSGAFPRDIRLERLQLSDAQGVWLTAEHIALRWSPTALLLRHVSVESLEVGRLDVERRPVSEPSAEKGTVSVPRSDVQRLAIDTLVLGPALAGSRAVLNLQGAAHLVSLADAAGHVRARRTDGPGGSYEFALRFDPTRMDAQLRVEEPAGGALENLLQYPSLGGLAVTANLSGARSAEHVLVSVRAGELRADVHGEVDLTRQSADLSYSADAPAMTPRPGLAWQRIALHGRWRGARKAPQADGQVLIEGLTLPGDAAAAVLRADLSAERGAVTLHATAEGLVLPGPRPRLLADGPLSIAATLRLDAPERPLQLSASHRLLTLQAQAVTAGEPRASFSVHLPDLAPLAALAGLHVRGNSALTGTLRQSPDATHFELRADSEVANEAALPVAVLSGRSRLQLAGSLTERALELERLTLSGRTLAASASGSARRATTPGASAFASLQARYEVGLTDLGVLARSLGGTAKLKGELDGPPGSFATRAELAAAVSVRGAPRESIEAHIKANGLPALAGATVTANGTLLGAPLQFETSLQRPAEDTYHLIVQRAAWKSAHADGDLTADTRLTAGRGSLRLRVDRLADLAPLLGTNVQGSAAGSLTLKPAAHGSDVDARLEARNVVMGGIAADARLHAAGSADALSLQLTVQAPNVGGGPAHLDTMARVNLDARELALERAEARYRGQTVRLLSPARVSFADGLAVRDLQLAVQQARIEVDGRIAPELELRASVHHVDAALVGAFLPNVLAQGTLDADAQLTGPASAPSGVLKVQAAQLRFANPAVRDLQALAIQATARLQGNAAQVDAHLSGAHSSQLVLTGGAPLSAAGTLNLRLEGTIDAALANPVIEARGERAAGRLTVNANVTGPLSAPQIAGTVDLAHGDLRDYTQGIHLSDITAHLVGTRDTLKIASLTARAAPGQISMDGTIGLLQPQLPLDVHLTATNAQPISSDLLTANLSADLHAKGTVRDRLDVSGTLNLHRTLVGIPNALPPDVAVLDVRRPGAAPPPPAEHKLVIGLDVRVQAPREVRVQGRGLNAELGGDLRLRGTTDDPRVSGGFDLIRGTFALASTQLDFTTGRISFNGAGLHNKIDPTLDFTAQTATADATVTLHVTGFADAPQFTLESSPQLPQDEILARLLFGVSASQLSALQVAQIGAALASLSGVGGGGPNPLARLQKSLGLDRLSVGSGAPPGAAGTNSGTSVEAGRYVSERVFVGLKHSTTGFSQVEADVDLSKHLKLRTQLGNGTATTQGTTPENDPGSSVGLAYQFEY